MNNKTVSIPITINPTPLELEDFFDSRKGIYYPMNFERFLKPPRRPFGSGSLPHLEMRQVDQKSTAVEFYDQRIELVDVAPLIWWLATQRPDNVVVSKVTLVAHDCCVCFIYGVRPGQSYVHVVNQDAAILTGEWVANLSREMH